MLGWGRGHGRGGSPVEEEPDALAGPDGEAPSGPQKVAAIICAHNVGHDIASTVRSCRAIPGVDLIVVIDDGSDDDTGHHARMAGAVVVRHSVTRGRASARETGVKVAAMRDRADWPPRLLLFLSADLGESAVEATGLVDAVASGRADCACALRPAAATSPEFTAAERLARGAIRRATGWEPFAPLSEMRCFTRDALSVVMPFSTGFGLEVGMTIDMLVGGFRMVEIPCHFTHTGADRSIGELSGKQRWAEVALAVSRRRIGREFVPVAVRRRWARADQRIGAPYPPEEE